MPSWVRRLLFSLLLALPLTYVGTAIGDRDTTPDVLRAIISPGDSMVKAVSAPEYPGEPFMTLFGKYLETLLITNYLFYSLMTFGTVTCVAACFSNSVAEAATRR
jgi:hypothetical protein